MKSSRVLSCVEKFENKVKKGEELPFAEFYLSVPFVYEYLYGVLSVQRLDDYWLNFVIGKSKDIEISPRIVVAMNEEKEISRTGPRYRYKVIDRYQADKDYPIVDNPVMTVVPISLILGREGHSVVGIISHDDKTVEIFDPQGTGAEWAELSEKTIISMLRLDYRDYTIKRSVTFCPKRSWQGTFDRHTKGTCQLFSYIYLYLRLHCRDIPASQLVKYILELDKNRVNRLEVYFLLAIWDSIDGNLRKDLEMYSIIATRDYLQERDMDKQVKALSLRVKSSWPSATELEVKIRKRLLELNILEKRPFIPDLS